MITPAIKILTLLLFALSVASCTITTRDETANRLAYYKKMQRAIIETPSFALTSFAHMDRPNAGRARIYIEGDGLAWLNRRTPSLDPTPKNPVALKLASLDPAPNVIYLARPCQYSKMSNPTRQCKQIYWTHKRFAPEVITAYHYALDELKERHNIQHIELIGFSGGANVAALLAAKRDDVTSLRTVAGNVDHRAHSRYHEVDILQGSLNAADYTADLQTLPQTHFVGRSDKNITPAIYESYAFRMEDISCTRLRIVDGAGHAKGWAEQWPTLIKYAPYCD